MNVSGCCVDVTIGIVKYLLCFINFLVIVPGIALIVGGVLLQSLVFDYYGSFFQDVVKCVEITAIIVGSVTLVLGVSGGLGAMLSNRKLLLTYGVLMIVLIAGQVAYGIVLLTKVKFTKEYVVKELNIAFNEINVDNQSSELFDFIQDTFNCCGVESAKDYLPIFPNRSLPITCCGVNDVQWCNQVTAYSRGCVIPLSEYLSKIVAGIGGIILLMVLVQMIPTAIGFCLAHRYRVLRKQDQVVDLQSDPRVNLLQQVEPQTLGDPFAADEKYWSYID